MEGFYPSHSTIIHFLHEPCSFIEDDQTNLMQNKQADNEFLNMVRMNELVNM